MSEKEKQSLEKLGEALPKLTPYDQGRLIGQAEGLAMAFAAQEQKQECIAGKEYQGTF